MPEQVDLPVPVVRTHAAWKLDLVVLHVAAKAIEVRLTGANGETLQAMYPTPAPAGSAQPSGAALLTALNTANLTSNSLVKRIFTRLIADGYITGSITGTPE